MDKADQLIVLVDSSKFRSAAAFVVCGLDDIDVVITDAGVQQSDLELMRAHDIEVIVAR
jgi:DeoR family ulaG and ulaABCDEF operon transcriptional repressor